MSNLFFRRRWDESRGDEFDSLGHSVWYFEVGDDGWPARQVEAYDTGPVLRYGPGHEEDRYGGLGQTSLDDLDDDWGRYKTDRGGFERAWQSAGGWAQGRLSNVPRTTRQFSARDLRRSSRSRRVPRWRRKRVAPAVGGP
ncbi:hypothetical protein ACWD01_32935 [Streptomyces sp. NPDC002835]